MNRRNFLKLLSALPFIKLAEFQIEPGVQDTAHELISDIHKDIDNVIIHQPGLIAEFPVSENIAPGNIIYDSYDGSITNDGTTSDSPLPVGIAITKANAYTGTVMVRMGQ